MTRGAILFLAAAAMALASPVGAADLFKSDSWSSLASDPRAARVGDSLTVVVIESSTATNSVQNGSKKKTRFSGEVAYGSQSEAAALGLSGDAEGGGQTGRSGRMVAQIGVVIDEILPNGDLRVSGEHVLKINGETTRIKLRGRVRRLDLTRDNSVLSNRLADAEIEYDGSGFLARSAKPGIVGQIFNLLGLM
jgi:flagellar L-ring protein precursor FlgH